MQETIKTVAPSLRALLEGFIDYAGLYPPAKVPLDQAMKNYESYRSGQYAWMLRWFVLGAAELAALPGKAEGKFSVLCDSDEARATTIESTSVIQTTRPTYCEVSLANLDQLDKIKEAKLFAKIRTGGLKPEAIPTPEAVAAFIKGCAVRKLPFKATAGLHHPIRAEQALTYEENSPRAVLHGFINVLMAAAFAWHTDIDIVPILEETDATAFRFDECAHWRDKTLTQAQIKVARKEFMHSVGSCSFDEPVQDLKNLGFL